MSEIHRRRPRRNKFEFSFVGNDCRPSQKSGTRRENRNAPDSPDLSSSIPDDRGYLLSLVFISRQNLGQSGNGKIPDRLGFSRHMKTRLNKGGREQRNHEEIGAGFTRVFAASLLMLPTNRHATQARLPVKGLSDDSH